MDPNGRIYEDLDEAIPAEDKARLDGYLKGRAESDALADFETLRAEVKALHERFSN